MKEKICIFNSKIIYLTQRSGFVGFYIFGPLGYGHIHFANEIATDA